MTGAAIVRWEVEGAVVLAVHGAFDGASAWALRVDMEESSAREFVVDLTHVVEAYEFAANVIATWQRGQRDKRVRFRVASTQHARLLSGFGLEVVEAPAEAPVAVPYDLMPYPVTGSGVPA